MSCDADALARILRNEADPANRRRVETVLEYLDPQPHDVVLDCGCGLGWFLKVISELYDCRLYGIDPDIERLRRAGGEVGGKAALAAGTIASLPFPSNSFDKIVLSEVLEHVIDDAGGLKEARRVLRPGGVMAITVPNRHYPFLWDPVNAVRERFGRPPIRRGMFGGIWTNHLRLYSRSDLVDLVRQTDLAVDDVRSFVHYCIPFAHNLVYGIGKPLVESGVLPGADRFRYADNGGRLNPLKWALGLVNLIDRLNLGAAPATQSTVCLSIKAIKPAS